MADDRILLRMCRMSGHEMKFINEAFEGEWVVPLGPNVAGFEKDLEKFLGEDRRVVALSSGTAALHLGLIMLGVGEGDEVMVQSMTFSASVNPVRYVGAIPVMVDSEPKTWNIDADLLDRAIADRVATTGKKPKAIIAV
ncbi:MAG: aminotransferase class I/II-fold pyridoxal phosphate-dependent enzyme, partial [Muribaculaceae bacterium]|nr:aminotransferase class I/II-fold pyridoxal phosphate-dependent enzyme [Muribaculaceae bacterium]